MRKNKTARKSINREILLIAGVVLVVVVAALAIVSVKAAYVIPILMYHSIGRNRAQFTVTPESFEMQMASLKLSGRECLKLSEFAERLRMVGM